MHFTTTTSIQTEQSVPYLSPISIVEDRENGQPRRDAGVKEETEVQILSLLPATADRQDDREEEEEEKARTGQLLRMPERAMVEVLVSVVVAAVREVREEEAVEEKEEEEEVPRGDQGAAVDEGEAAATGDRRERRRRGRKTINC